MTWMIYMYLMNWCIIYITFCVILWDACEGLQKVNCNIGDNSTVLLSCRSYEQIFINSIFYHQPETECQGTGSCKSRFRTGDSNFSPVCQYKYGECNQTLDTTVLNNCKTHNLSIAAEVDYDCRMNQSAKGTYSVQILGSNTSDWIADIMCPSQAFIYIQSMVYWTLNNNSTCSSKRRTIPEEQLRLINYLCIKQHKCQLSLLYNITTRDGCQLEWPNLAATVNYTCIEEAVDVCSDIVRISSDSITTLYLKSPTVFSSNSTMPSSCSCQVYGNEMGVKILYLDFPTMNSVRGDLYFTPAPDSVLNLTTPLINTTIFSNISNVTVTFDHRNLYKQYFLLEFKALESSFLQVSCRESENDTHVSISSTFTDTTVSHGEERKTQATTVSDGEERKTKDHDGVVIILAVLFSVCLLLLLVSMIVIITLIRTGKLVYKSKVREEQTANNSDSPYYTGLDSALRDNINSPNYSQLSVNRVD